METVPKTDWPEMVMHSISLLVIPSRPLLYAALTLRQFRFPQNNNTEKTGTAHLCTDNKTPSYCKAMCKIVY